MPEIEYKDPHAEEIQEIMERTPGWMMRWGITLFFGFVVVLLTLSWFISYPDVVNTDIVITSEHPPVNLVAATSGKLKALFVKDRQQVDSNTVLALIDNPAEYNDVLALKRIIADSSYRHIHLPVFQLGDIETAYTVFKQAAEDFMSYKTIGINEHKIVAVEQQFYSQQLLYSRLTQQANTLNEEYHLAAIKFQADSQLFVSGYLSKLDYNTSRSTLLDKKYACQGISSTLAQTQVQLNQCNTTLTELRMQGQVDDEKYPTSLNKALAQLKAAIQDWEQKYLVVSPIPGIVNLFNYWAVNMPVKQGDVLMIVTPSKTGKVIGRVNLPVYGSAKVKEGEMVNIRLANYPAEEFGFLSGQVASVSLLPKDSLYSVVVIFPKGLISSYNKQLEFKQQMIGTTEIITEKRRLLERILNKFKIK
jgi:multidrug efflux pump subunit AcrA (membrane-fusion protein)